MDEKINQPENFDYIVLYICVRHLPEVLHTHIDIRSSKLFKFKIQHQVYIIYEKLMHSKYISMLPRNNLYQ